MSRTNSGAHPANGKLSAGFCAHCSESTQYGARDCHQELLPERLFIDSIVFLTMVIETLCMPSIGNCASDHPLLTARSFISRANTRV
eukprot:1092652-Amphidinium_carterae.1